jgi:hypothetical protein
MAYLFVCLTAFYWACQLQGIIRNMQG